MKTKLLFAALMLTFGAAQAQVNGTTNSQATAETVSSAQNAGNVQGISFNSKSPNWLVTTPGLGSGVYPVSNSPKSCANAAGMSGVAPAVGLQFSQPSHGHSCEMLLMYDMFMLTSMTFHNIAVNSKTPDAAEVAMIKSLAKTPEDAEEALKKSLAMRQVAAEVAMKKSLAAQQVAFDHACMVSVVSFKLMDAQGMCSPTAHLLAATGVLAADPNSYQPTTRTTTGEY